MKRVNLYITDEQHELLKRLHKNTGLRISEHIRKALDEYFQRNKRWLTQQ